MTVLFLVVHQPTHCIVMQASWTFADILCYSYSLETCRGSAVLSYVYRANNSNLFKRLHLHTSIWIINPLKFDFKFHQQDVKSIILLLWKKPKGYFVWTWGTRAELPRASSISSHDPRVRRLLLRGDRKLCLCMCVCVAFVKKMNNVAGCESAFGLRQINLQLAFWIVTAKLLIHFLLDWQRCWPESYLLMFIKSFLEWHHPSTQASFWLLLIGS